MSSQKGNVSRSRGQKHQNSTAYRNDLYGTTVQVQKAKSKTHAGLCQHCKGVLEWKVKYNKYKPITQAKKCVKCSQKTVKDAYHVICKPCSVELEVCCKCGKKEDIVVPLISEEQEKEQEEGEDKKKRPGSGKRDVDELDSDDDYDSDDLSDHGKNDDDDEDDGGLSQPKKTQNKSDVLPDVSRVTFKE